MKRISIALMMVAITACHQPPPEGQALANVAGRELTLRELKQSLDQPLDSRDARNTALHALVVRTALAAEAETRGLEQDAQFHFALRDAQDRLLVDALRRQVRSRIVQPAEAEVSREMAQYPWRYSARFVMVLAAGGPGGTVVTLDSAALAQDLAPELAQAVTGDRVSYGGDQWQVLSRSAPGLTPSQLRGQAREALVNRATDAILTEIVDSYRQRGLVRYQEGWGSASDSRR